MIAQEQALSLTPFQRGIVLDQRRFVVAAAGRGSGKSTAVTNALLLRMEDREIDGVFYPKFPDGSRILVFGPSYPQMRMGTIKTFDRWFEQTPYLVRKIDGNEPERRMVRDIVFYFRNASNPDQTRSHETTAVWLDEYAQMSSEVLRLSNASQRQWGTQWPHYQTYITSTPRGRNHFYTRFQEQIEEERRFVNTFTDLHEGRSAWCDGGDGVNDDPRIGYYRTDTFEAQASGVDVPDNYVEDMGYEEGSEMYRQEIMADFVTWSGLVFNTPKVAYALPKFEAVYGGVDVGGPAPSAIELVGITPSNDVYVFGEKYQPRMQLHDLVTAVSEKHVEHRVRRWHVDNDIIWRMINKTMPCRPPYKHKDAAGAAIAYINNLISKGKFFIHESCGSLLHEMETYQYKEMQSGDEVTFLDKVKPNQLDHAIDAMRYAILPLSASRSTRGAGQWGEVRFG